MTAFLLVWALAATAYAVLLVLTRQRVYRYAVRMMDRSTFPGAGSNAYSDMATVILLNGRCSDALKDANLAELDDRSEQAVTHCAGWYCTNSTHDHGSTTTDSTP